MRKFISLIASFIIILPLFSCGEEKLILEGTYSEYGDSGILAGMSFPPYSNEEQIEFTVDELDNLSVDRMRIAIDWRDREPVQGDFYWTPMDYRMEQAANNSIKVFLTIISLAPDWAVAGHGTEGANFIDEAALQTFIETLLNRYDNIELIQFGNEWESGTEDGSVYNTQNSAEKFVAYTNILYDAVQRLSPETKVVLGGLTRTYPICEYFADDGVYPDFSGIQLANGATLDWLHERVDKIKSDYASDGLKTVVEYVLENADYDIIDIHLYDDPENWPKYLSTIPGDKPVLVSEFGGPNSEFENTNANYQAERMDDYIDAIEQLPIIEAYYFKLVETEASYHSDSGLFYSSYAVKPSRDVFARRLKPLQ